MKQVRKLSETALLGCAACLWLTSCGQPAPSAEASPAEVPEPSPAGHVADTSSIVGDYVQPNPIDTTSVQGFRLLPGGRAESIGLADWEFRSWRLVGDTVFIDNVSHTSGTPYECVDTGLVDAEEGVIRLLGDAYRRR